MREAAVRRDEYFASVRAEVDAIIADSGIGPGVDEDETAADARDAATCAALLAERPQSA